MLLSEDDNFNADDDADDDGDDDGGCSLFTMLPSVSYRWALPCLIGLVRWRTVGLL